MSENSSLLADMATRLFTDLGPGGGDDFAAWPAIEDNGFNGLLLAEDAGGFGGDWADFLLIARLLGRHAVALPVGESILAAHLAATSGLDAPAGALSLAPRLTGTLTAGRFTGSLKAVPWGRHVSAVVGQLDDMLLLLHSHDATISHGENPAGEPRDSLNFQDAPVQAATLDPSTLGPHGLGALLRAGQIAGALNAALELAVAHANDRVQFGRPIGKFQAVQHALAQAAGHAAALDCAAQAAFWRLGQGEAMLETAAAKLRANMAADIGAAIAHQVHGAIGFTREHGLHHFTRRLIAWRSEFGHDAFWAARLGAMACQWGADGFWPTLTGRSDPAPT